MTTLLFLAAALFASAASAQDREALYYLQLKMHYEGIYPDDPDGLSGPRTRQAIAEYAQKYGFEPTAAAMLEYHRDRFDETSKPMEDEENLALLREGFDDKLLDPYSAHFKDVVILPNGHVCGYVNAKNAYGAYVGYNRFFAVTTSWTIGATSSTSYFPAFIDSGDDHHAEYLCILDLFSGASETSNG